MSKEMSESGSLPFDAGFTAGLVVYLKRLGIYAITSVLALSAYLCLLNPTTRELMALVLPALAISFSIAFMLRYEFATHINLEMSREILAKDSLLGQTRLSKFRLRDFASGTVIKGISGDRSAVVVVIDEKAVLVVLKPDGSFESVITEREAEITYWREIEIAKIQSMKLAGKQSR
jgi:hypothetical protein